MRPIKYWDFWTWLMLACTALNAFTFVTTFSILSLIFGVLSGCIFIERMAR